MISIIGKIENGKYYLLLDYLFSKCDVFTFHLPDKFNEFISENNIEYFPWCNLNTYVNSIDSKEFEEYKNSIEYRVREFRRFFIKEYIDVEYAGNIYGNKMEIKVIRFDESLLGALKATSGLYDWQYPKMPEDLCFYSQGKCFLRSVAHEKMCIIYSDDYDTIYTLKKIGLKYRHDINDLIPPTLSE